MSTLLVLACAAATVRWSESMAGGMVMPGGWTLSMSWMRMPGQTWPGAALSFEGMWVVMMVAMMLPALVPLLARCPSGGLSAVAGAGYFAVWAGFGLAAYPLGVMLAGATLRSSTLARAAPLVTGVVLVVAGALQFTAWKLRHLRCCRDCLPAGPAGIRTAWRYGLTVAGHCVQCCAGFMALLLAAGMMNLGIVALVAGGITVERLAAWPERVARALGLVVLGAGGWMIVQALMA